MENQIRESLLRQKVEKETLLARKYILRTNTPQNIDQGLENGDLIKVILGPRRSGKSVYGLNLLKDKDFIYINFDDQALTQENNHNDLFKAILEVHHNIKYIFLDEVQNLPQWELFISQLHREGYNIVLTGSNSKLLSKELSTRITGRYIEGEILPFSFKEYLSAKLDKSYAEIDVLLFHEEGINPYQPQNFIALEHLTKYLVTGGYPIVVTTDIDYRNYLDTLFNAILFEDVVKRYEIRASFELSRLAKYLISIFAKEYSYTKLKNILGFINANIVQSYIGYLEGAYLVQSLNRYSTKYKEQINSSKKVFIIDNGFVSAFYLQGADIQSRLLENQVFIELLRQGYAPNQTLFYYKTRNGKEVDFVVKDKFNKVEKLIQVCYSIENLDTRKREVNALDEASEELKCDNRIIITWTYSQFIDNEHKPIRCIPLWDFLIHG